MLLPAWVERGVEHPAGLAREPLGGPGVAVVEVGDHGVQQLGRDRADRAQLVDGGQVDDVLADQLLRALGQLEDLHPRGHAVLGPAERLRGAVLGQAAVEHRVDRLGLLVGVQLLARDVLDRAVGVLGLGVAHDDRHVGQAERPRGGDPVKAGDELEAVAVVADDDRDEHALQLDRAGERLDVLGVERADVLGDADLVERDLAPGLVDGGGHQVLLDVVARPAGGPIPAPPARPPGRATLGWRVGPSAGEAVAPADRVSCGVPDVPHALVERTRSLLTERGRELGADADDRVSSGAGVSSRPVKTPAYQRSTGRRHRLPHSSEQKSRLALCASSQPRVRP